MINDMNGNTTKDISRRTPGERLEPLENDNRLNPAKQPKSDEPFFEPGPLTDGQTFAFRDRAKNSAGYGGYTEIWVTEVVR